MHNASKAENLNPSQGPARPIANGKEAENLRFNFHHSLFDFLNTHFPFLFSFF